MLLTPPNGGCLLPEGSCSQLLHAGHSTNWCRMTNLLCAPPLFVRALQAGHEWVVMGSAVFASQQMASRPVPL